MFSRPDSPPPRQPSPDLVHIPLTPPRRHATPVGHPPRQLATTRSCDRFGERPPSGRSLHSRSCENLRSRDDELSPETAAQGVPTPFPSRARTRHISFSPSPAATKPAPPVPPLPLYLRSYQDDSDIEKSSESSWEGHPRSQLIRTSPSNASLRRKSKSPPPEPLTRRPSRLVSLTRIKFFSWRGITHYPSPQGP